MTTTTTTRETTIRDTGTPGTAARIWAIVRMALGWVFLWAFLDKAFSLGFATGRAEDGSIDFFGDAAWINGGSPTEGFLSFATKGPFQSAFEGLAGQAWVDWIFMLGLLGIGVGLILGVAMRLSAFAGAVMLVLMYLAGFVWPEHNPFMDDHLVYALVLIGLVFVNADRTWGLGDRWRSLDMVERYPILR